MESDRSSDRVTQPQRSVSSSVTLAEEAQGPARMTGGARPLPVAGGELRPEPAGRAHRSMPVGETAYVPDAWVCH